MAPAAGMRKTHGCRVSDRGWGSRRRSRGRVERFMIHPVVVCSGAPAHPPTSLRASMPMHRRATATSADPAIPKRPKVSPNLQAMTMNKSPEKHERAHGSSVEGYSLVLIVILILLVIPQPLMLRPVDGSLLMHAVRGCAADQSDQHGEISNEDLFSRFSMRKPLFGHKQDYDYESTTPTELPCAQHETFLAPGLALHSPMEVSARHNRKYCSIVST